MQYLRNLLCSGIQAPSVWQNRLLCHLTPLVLFLGCSQSKSNALIIATAANVHFAMEEVIKEFGSNTGISCETITSSSGKIAAQLLEGAPFDIFVSADMYYPQEIYQAGLAISPPKVYATGKLVFWSFVEKETLDLSQLTSEKIDHIAIANPKIAPYGRAAVEALKFYNLYDKVVSKLVYGESIAQVNQFLLSGAAYGGFTAKAVVMSPRMRDIGVWMDLDINSYKPIDQGMIILANSKMLLEANEFEQFLISEKGASILKRYGYEIK